MLGGATSTEGQNGIDPMSAHGPSVVFRLCVIDWVEECVPDPRADAEEPSMDREREMGV